jgi:hypothetical protein
MRAFDNGDDGLPCGERAQGECRELLEGWRTGRLECRSDLACFCAGRRLIAEAHAVGGLCVLAELASGGFSWVLMVHLGACGACNSG